MASKSSALEYVDDSGPGSPAGRRATGWAYFDPKGKRITDRDEIDRLNRIALPPAYTDAWFCPKDCGHLLATGIDARGRKQYRYNPSSARQEAEKFDGCAAFGRALPKAASASRRTFARRTLCREQVVASVGATARSRRDPRRQRELRQGEQELRRDHAAPAARQGLGRQGQAALQGQERPAARGDDQRRAGSPGWCARCRICPASTCSSTVNGDGEPHPVGSHDVNDYLRETMGEDFTAKNFRTWHASVLAFCLLAEAEPAADAQGADRPRSARTSATPRRWRARATSTRR
jgi:DNA topoisomerase-1